MVGKRECDTKPLVRNKHSSRNQNITSIALDYVDKASGD